MISHVSHKLTDHLKTDMMALFQNRIINSPPFFITNTALFGKSIVFICMIGQEFQPWQNTHSIFHQYSQAESPIPRQSHSLVYSTKPGALVSPLSVQTGNRETMINNHQTRWWNFCLNWSFIHFKKYHWSLCENPHTLYYVAEVTVVGAVVKQAVPECRHGRTLNSNQVKHAHDILEQSLRKRATVCLNLVCISSKMILISLMVQKDVLVVSDSPLCGSPET